MVQPGISEEREDREPETLPLKLEVEAEVAADPAPVSFRKLLEGTSAMTRTYLLVGSAATCVFTAAFIFLFYILGLIFDEIAYDDEEDNYDVFVRTSILASFWVPLGLTMMLTGFISALCFTRASQEVGMVFRKRYLHALLRKDMAYFDLHSAAELPEQMHQDCEIIESGMGDKLMGLLTGYTYSLFGMMLNFEKSPQITLVALAVAPMAIGGCILNVYGALKGAEAQRAGYVRAGAVAEESLGAVKTVAAFNAENYMQKEYNERLDRSRKVAAMGAMTGLGWGMIWCGMFLTFAVIYWVSAKWISDDRKNWIWNDVIEGPDVLVIGFTMTTVYLGFMNIIPGLAAYTQARTAAARAFAFAEEPVAFVNGSQTPDLQGNIEFQDVYFAYPRAPDRPILKGVTFSCQQGQKTAIVGESGAGKSTIIQLLERFYEPSQGVISYDGIPATDLDISCLRRQVGYVSQEPVLFHLTIEENILLGCPTASAQEVEQAAKEAHAFDFVMSLQDGFHTHVGSKGSKLSGGQKQRIAIARAILKKPKILFLDEATSALDNESEDVVLRALDEIHSRMGMTMVSVAQKLSTIRSSHRIIVLRDGRVDEAGTHDELSQRDGLYAQMCAAQGSILQEVEGTMPVVSQEKASTEEVEDATSERLQLAQSACLAWRVVKSLFPYWPLLILTVVTACVAATTFPLFGFSIAKLAHFSTSFSGEVMEDNVRTYSILLMVVSLTSLVALCIMVWTLVVLTHRLTRDLREQSFRKMLHLDAQFFDRPDHNPSLLSLSLNSDAKQLNDGGGPLIGCVLLIIVSYTVGSTIGIIYQWKLGLLLAALIPFECMGVARGYFTLQAGLVHPNHQRAAILATETSLNLKTVAAMQMQNTMEQRYAEALQVVYEESKQDAHYNYILYGVGFGLEFFIDASGFIFGAYLRQSGQAEYSDIAVTFFSTYISFWCFLMTVMWAPDLFNGIRAAARMFALLDYTPAIDSMDSAGLTAEIKGQVNFNNVGFHYAGRDNAVLQGVTFEVGPERHVGITGASGSGKTTLMQLLLRFYDPTEGLITVDGVDIRQYNIKHLRSAIALVSQEPVLFSGTVRNNVDFGLGRPDEEIRTALMHASIPRFAEELDRDVGTHGSAISGGQKQRLAIARAILRNPRILLLDEATSALDSRTEKKILNALEFAGRGRTVLVIAHRLSTIQHCDEILVMDAGQIKERGSHEELLKIESGIYRRLLAQA